VRRIVPIGRSQRPLPDQDEAVETLLGAVNLIIGHVQTHVRRIVLVIDGLDWIRGDDRQLAHFSGGRAREFTKLTREVAERAWSEDVAQLSSTLVEQVLADARRECERGLHAGHAVLLRQVLEDPDRLPDNPDALKLIESARLLPFDNDAPWFSPHPLLRMRFLRDAGSTG